jgi:3-hydroxybutyryl-CoA dehydrogenase
MRILVFAKQKLWDELVSDNSDIEWLRAENADSFNHANDVDAYFDFSETDGTDYAEFKKPILINSVAHTLSSLNTPVNVLRINGWNGFLKRKSWEVAGIINDECREIFKALNKKIIPVPDEPGFIAARIIAMIINEAYFAKAENVSTEKEIDTAMKLGTNYPYGPFEWAQIIGENRIYELLKILSDTDIRYKPAYLLEAIATKKQ